MQEKNVRKRLLYRTLRVMSGVMTGMMALASLAVAYSTVSGSTELVSDFAEIDGVEGPLSIAAKAAVVGTVLLSLLAFWLLFRSINLFLQHTERGELFINEVEIALSRMGTALILLYFVFLSYDIVVPMLILPDQIFDNSIDFLISFIDLNALTLLIGIVLRTLAGVLREGRAAQDELNQIL